MFVIAPPGVVAYPNINVDPFPIPSCLDKLQDSPVDPFVIVAYVAEYIVCPDAVTVPLIGMLVPSTTPLSVPIFPELLPPLLNTR